MVNNSVIVFENKKIVLNPDDEKFKSDLEGYRLKGVTSTGSPIYSDENEHTIDAMNLCLLIFEQNHGELFKDLIKSRVYTIEGLNPENIDVVERRMNDVEKKESLVLSIHQKGIVKVIDNRPRKRKKTFTRSKL